MQVLQIKLLTIFFTKNVLYLPEAGLLNKSSSLAPALGVTKFTIGTYDFGHTLLCYLSWTKMFNKHTSDTLCH